MLRSKDSYPPMIHNLLKLAEGSGLELSKERKETLDVITNFNLSARYDNYKEEFYKRCTKSFTKEWIGEIKTLRKWIKEKHLG